MGDHLRAWYRRDQRKLRHTGHAAHPPGTARLAGDGVHGPGLEHEEDGPPDCHLLHLSPVIAGDEGSPAARCVQPAAGARFRVEAETVRDIALAASGLLSPKMGGASVFPYQPEGIWDRPYSHVKWEMSEGEDRYRRGIYTFIRRTAPYPSLTVFDAPSREFCTIRRVRTNTPLQALTTLNDPAFFEAARALAKKMMTEGGPDPAAQASYGF